MQHNETIIFSKDEICTFVAIILLSGYNAKPCQRHYWSQDDDLACPAVSRSMTRNCFDEIKRFLHFVDNDCLPQGDKTAKIRLLQGAVNASLQKFEIFSEDPSAEKQMVLNFGNHLCKIFVRVKLIRFGYQNWVLASSCGYLLKFETCVGHRG